MLQGLVESMDFDSNDLTTDGTLAQIQKRAETGAEKLPTEFSPKGPVDEIDQNFINHLKTQSTLHSSQDLPNNWYSDLTTMTEDEETENPHFRNSPYFKEVLSK
mmetsp:Transcript_29760/g.45358  ORF Transcript_29760/g.45358 Transcript_29760/m.45358 type:complete len:104 (+) Transcript_29760:1033-1344(+)